MVDNSYSRSSISPQPQRYSDTRDRRDYQSRNAQRGRAEHNTVTRRSGTDTELIEDLHRLDGRSYGSYKLVTGDWDYGDFRLAIDHVQSDPYAPPSSLRVKASPATMGLTAESLHSREARIAVADFLIRSFSRAIQELPNTSHSDSSIKIVRVGQEILERSACTVTPDAVELRFQCHLPARGRTIQGHQAARIFDEDIPDVILTALDFVSDEAIAGGYPQALDRHVHAYEDYCALQKAITDHNWLCFVPNGAILPRRSGISDAPLSDAIPFSSPDTLSATVTLPHSGTITGMAVAPGITLITGGGYHGKSTLLHAIERGVYAHIPGDGRELIATTPNAMKIRAYDGRPVTGVDVSPFIAHLPGKTDTASFSTQNASGSTSQAASLIEAVEARCPLLLLDEDTSATNLLIRDARMRELIASDQEPITPLVDRIRTLHRELQVSTIMVMGGSGDYLDVADRVLMMNEYHCTDVTLKAEQVVKEIPRALHDSGEMSLPQPRVPLRSRGGAHRPKTKANGRSTLILDKQEIDISDIEQVTDVGQAEAIAWALRLLLEDYCDARHSLLEGIEHINALINEGGLDTLTKNHGNKWPAFLARPRVVDIAAALNRYRALTLSGH